MSPGAVLSHGTRAVCYASVQRTANDCTSSEWFLDFSELNKGHLLRAEQV
jgi:hypothetical protein